jgi:uncharacterized protein (DUF302 family)
MRMYILQRAKKDDAMSYYYSRKLKIPFDEVVAKVTQTLKDQGFGIITAIDLKDALKQKIGVDFRNYKILGACNPQFAYKAVSMESHIGVMLPCNVVVQEHENGEVEISAINPIETLDKATEPSLAGLAEEVSLRLRAAIDDLHPEPDQAASLPRASGSGNMG